MLKLPVRIGLLVLAAAAVIYSCSSSPQAPQQQSNLRSSAYTSVSVCGEVVYLSMLSPVLAVWEDSIETWRGDPGLLDTAPQWTGSMSVGEHLDALVPVLQQWRGAINGAVGSALLDTLAAFDAATESRQDYLAGMSSLLLSWEMSMENLREADFLPTPPTFVRDETPPMIECIGDTTITCADTSGVMVEFEAMAIDDCDPSPMVTSDPPSGTIFKPGATLVTVTAADSSGNTAECTFTVNVEAAEPPVINSAAASPSMLWPPNHKWVDVRIVLDVESECDESPDCEIIDVTSNEPANGLGDGDTSPDWMITGDNVLKLRAERSGTGSGRVYTVMVRCTDDFGNAVDTTVEVTVPHDRGGKN